MSTLELMSYADMCFKNAKENLDQIERILKSTNRDLTQLYIMQTIRNKGADPASEIHRATLEGKLDLIQTLAHLVSMVTLDNCLKVACYGGKEKVVNCYLHLPHHKIPLASVHLEHAVLRGHLRIVELLLTVLPSHSKHFLRNSVWTAVRFGHVEITELFLSLDEGFDEEEVLELAIDKKQVGILEMMFRSGFITSGMVEYYMPMVIESDNWKMIQLFVENGGDVFECVLSRLVHKERLCIDNWNTSVYVNLFVSKHTKRKDLIKYLYTPAYEQNVWSLLTSFYAGRMQFLLDNPQYTSTFDGYLMLMVWSYL